MIPWLLALTAALAQEGQPCGLYEPIAGTAGFANGLTAVRTNAQTYGAGSFARERLRGTVYAAMDYRGVFGVARVPALCTDSSAALSGQVVEMPLDLGATNLGFNAPLLEDEGKLHVGLRLFYASSVTTSTMGSRVFTAALPLINQYPAFFAPFIGQSASGGSLSTIAVDWIGGASFRSDIVSVQAGYTGVRGLYLDITQEHLALFVNTALQGGLQPADATYLLAGIAGFDPLDIGLDAVAPAGMTSLFYRRLPQSEAAEEDGLITQLRTGHLRQEDIGGLVDVRASWQLGEGAGLRELAVAGHTENWYRREIHGPRAVDEPSFYLRGGILRLPDQPLFGVEGGMRPTARAVARMFNPDSGWGLELAAQLNDPDLLDLYPFAYNALGVSMELSLDGGDW